MFFFKRKSKKEKTLFDRTPAVLKLKEVYSLEYVASRGDESYMEETDKYFNPRRIVNCFAHACFNLKNEHFKKFNIGVDCEGYFRHFVHLDNNDADLVLKEMKDFVESTGLQMQECALTDTPKDNQWKVAYYYDPEISAYHFMLQEKDGRWSSKFACEGKLEYFNQPPKIFDEIYPLQKILMITNPHAKTELNNDDEIEK